MSRSTTALRQSAEERWQLRLAQWSPEPSSDDQPIPLFEDDEPPAPARQLLPQSVLDAAKLPEPKSHWRLRARLSLYIGLIAVWAAMTLWLISDLLVTPSVDAHLVDRQQNVLAGADIVVLLVALGLVVLILTRDVVTPVRSLVDAAGAVSHGDYHRRIQPSGVREFDDLASAVNQMAEQLNAQLTVLSQQALRDPLTQLPNRLLFMDRLKRAIARARRLERTVAVLYLDLDDFKRINDTYGHDGGDQLLLQVAARLQAGLRTEDTAARLGGDEFIILLDGVASEADAVNVVERLMEQLLRPYTVADARLTVAASIGVALTDGHDANVEDLVRRADAAMYQAKGRGKGQYALYPAGARAV